MAEIKQLPRKIADQISAGEVIERPASVVKELVENSIDAGSSRIVIEVENGGKDKIRVQDNGSGIDYEELELAFKRYATSKINNINDLYTLHTLGFRGEALASIASISCVNIMSRKEKNNKGKKLVIKGGDIQKITPCGCQSGTDITVTDLFYNTPARFKYLKTTGTELGHISDTVYREALAHPEIKFLLKHNDRILVNTPGSGKLLDCIRAIYDQDLCENLLPEINFRDRFVTVRGYIARPDYNRSSRHYEIFIVNKRPIQNLTLNYAVEEAYKGYFKGKRYPIVFLHIELNPVLIDVNVHPTKRKIKFSRNNIIKDIIKKGVRAHIKNNDPAAKYTFSQPQTSKNDIKHERLVSKAVLNNLITKEKSNHTFHENRIITENKTTNNKSIISDDKTEYQPNKGKNPQIIKIMGQIHDTYIIAAAKDGLIIIDQHAAHERILYEKIKNKFNNNSTKTQPLLVPVNIEFTVTECELIKDNIDVIENLGFILEPFGTKSYVIQEVPLYIKNRISREVIKEIIAKFIQESDNDNLKKTDLINEMIQYMSCRGAVKAGDSLSNKEINGLINDLFHTSNPYNCPHGRPTLLHITEKELEKGLGRV